MKTENETGEGLSSPHPVDFEKSDKLTKELTLHNLLVIFAFSELKT